MNNNTHIYIYIYLFKYLLYIFYDDMSIGYVHCVHIYNIKLYIYICLCCLRVHE